MTTYQHKDGMIYDPEDGQTVATMSESATPEQGRMLAAAPELLTALKEIISQIDQGGSGGNVFARDYCISRARAVISNAT